MSARARRFLGPSLVILTMALVSFGLIMVFSAGAFMSFDPDRGGITLRHFSRQLVYAGVGLFALFCLARYDYAKLARWSKPLLFLSIVSLLLVLYSPLGVEAKGGRRWLDLGPLPNLQPSEFAKLAIILYLAERWSNRQDEMRRFFSGVLPNMLLVGVVIGLVLIEPHNSAAILLGVLVGAIWFAAGGRLLHLVTMAAMFLVAIGLVIFHTPYAMQRVRGYLYHEELASGASYQPVQAMVAFASGGLSGRGLGEGMHKIKSLPEPHTDYIFAVVGEELGFLATAGLTLGFMLLVWLGARTALQASDRLGYLLAAGATLLLGLQAFLNLGMVTRLLPSFGVPLPFISYGGSSIVVALAAVGLIVNVSRSTEVRPAVGRRK